MQPAESLYAFESEPQRCSEIGYSLRIANGIAVNCVRPNPGRFYISDFARMFQCTVRLRFELVVTTRWRSDTTRRVAQELRCHRYHHDHFGCAILTFSRNEGAFDFYHRLGFHRHVQLFCLQSMLAHAQANVGHLQKSPVEKEGFV